MNESAIGYEDGKITSYNGSAFSAGLNYSAGDNIVINGATIALDSAINLLDAQGAKAVSIDATEQQFTNLTSNNGSILDASGLYVSDLNMENAANLSKDGLYVTGTGSRISMSNDMSDIYGDNHFEIYGYQESGDGISAMHLGGNDLIVEHGENRTITATYSLTGACSSAQSALNIINSSDLTQYSAGANIDITDHVISGKDWTDEINDASANAYNQSTAWTDSQGYLTGVDLSEYAKTDFVISSIDAATSGKYDTSSFSAISGSFLTAHQSLPQSADWNGATTVVNNNSAIWNNTTNVVSSNSASWGATNPQIPVTGINGIKISESGDKVVFEVSGDYATHDDLTSKQDSLTYGYHDTAISSIDSSALYDSSAHARINTLAGRISDLSSNKLDESAFSDVSGDFATTGDINDLVTSIAETYQPKLSFEYNEDSAISAINGSALAGGGNVDISGVVEYRNKPETGAIYADLNTLANVGLIVGSGNSNFAIVPSAALRVPNIITAYDNGLTASGLTANNYGFTANGLTANASDSGFSANGISAGKRTPLCIEGQYEAISGGYQSGFTFQSTNTGFGTAKLTTAGGNQIVQVFSPKFEARNISGAGFSIEASGAKGYDHNGNVTWDTTVVPPANNLIGYTDTKASTGGLNGNIVLTVFGKTTPGPLSAAPYTIINADGLTSTYGPTANVPSIQIKPDNIIIQTVTGNSAKAHFGLQALGVKWETSAGTWSLTGSVQKREIECDTATSAITAIAGSAIGGGSELEFEYDAADNISAINNSAISTTPSRDLYIKAPLYTGMTGTSAYIACDTQNFATTAELSYVSGVVGDVESLLASL